MKKLKEDIRNSGYRLNYLASQIGVSSTMISLFLSGERNLKDWQIEILKNLVSKTAVTK